MAKREPEKYSLDPEEVKGTGMSTPGSEGGGWPMPFRDYPVLPWPD